MANDELVKCTFPSSKLWIGCLIKAFISHLRKDQKYLQKIKGDDMKTFKIRDIVVSDRPGAKPSCPSLLFTTFEKSKTAATTTPKMD